MKEIMPPEGATFFEIPGKGSNRDSPEEVLQVVDDLLSAYNLEVIYYTQEPGDMFYRFAIAPREPSPPGEEV